MLTYIARRVAQMVPVFLGVTVILFVLTAVLPGDPLTMRAGERSLSPQARAALVSEYGLDRPLHVQYVTYLGSLLRGDLGESYVQGREVADIYRDLYPNTARLALAAILVEILIGVAAGVISAVKKYSFADVLVTLSTSILVSIPVFWLGMLMQTLFGVYFKRWGLPYLPISGMSSARFPDWAHLIMPSIVLASVSTAYSARIMRAQLLEVLGQDYVRTALGKGLSRFAVIRRHALRNALIPVVTFMGLDFGLMMSGAVLTETIFNWPGVGFEIFRAIGRRDWPVVMGGVIVIVCVVMLVNLAVDVSYAFLDPRVRYGGRTESR